MNEMGEKVKAAEIEKEKSKEKPNQLRKGIDGFKIKRKQKKKSKGALASS